MIDLLRTKLFIPRPRKNQVSRPRLVDRLNTGLDKKLTLIAAPAGFGKTTLLSEWIPRSPRCVTWLSLDESDDDPVKFWTYFISSLQGLRPDLGESALALLQSPQSPPITSILTALINDITAFPDLFSIVLDDYHVLDSQSVHDAVIYLLDHLPANMHVMITTRIDPPLPLARLRAYDQLTELRANNLRFNVEETAVFLQQVMGLHLTAVEVAALEARTEGWIAGLQIAALSMQGREDVSGFIQAFSGSHRHILGYLADEVINQQSESTLNFLLQTSILDRLCGPLCDAVTGESGGQTILENLEHANLFIMPLDDEGKWHRYHHLFAEVLQARLQKNHSARLPELHRRAGDWYARQGLMEDAVRHELNGSNFEDAARLIARIAPAYIQRGESKTILNWVNSLPEENLFNNADLLSYQGWLLYVAGRIDQAKNHVEKSLAYLTRDTPSVARGRLAYLASQFAIAEGNMETVSTYARESLDLIGDEDFFFRILALMTVAGVHTLAGNTRDAISNLREAARIGEKSGQPLPTLTANAKLANLLNLHGELQEARVICEHAMNLYMDSFGEPLPISSIAVVEAAKLAYEEDNLDVLDQYIRTAIMQEKHLEVPGLAFETMYINSLFEMAKGNADTALDFARRGKNSAEQIRLIGYVSIFAALEANLMLEMGNLTQVKSWVESANLSDVGSDSLLLFHVQENIVHIRFLILQNRLSDANELLIRLENVVRRTEYTRHLMTIMTLKALLFHRQNDYGKAAENLEHAFEMAMPQNYRRVFLDEGEPMRLLLLDYQSTLKKKIGDSVDNESLRLLTYTDKLLEAFPQPAFSEKAKHETLPEPLSERELDILRLIATGRSNQEIADILVIAVSTVKSHINNLYSKLGTNRRTEALAIARELGLLSD